MDKEPYSCKFTQIDLNRYLYLLLFCFILVFCSGFSLPDTDQIRREFRKKVDSEVEKIIERTPDAKVRKKWRERRLEAVKALENARMINAKKYASQEFEDAEDFFQRARNYASKREYLKAEYLGRQTVKMAKKAAEKAAELYKAKLEKSETQLQECQKKLVRLKERVLDGDEDQKSRLAELMLRLGYVRNMIATGDFEEATKECSELERQIDEFAITLPGKNELPEEEHWI